MERNLCVPDTVSDDHILAAWNHIIGNNAVERIECRDSIKIIHLDPNFLDTLDEDELAEISEVYEDIDIEERISFYLCDPSIGWWICGRSGAEEHLGTVQFEVFFDPIHPVT